MSHEIARSTLLTSAPHAALMFPTLSPAQIARIASRGVIRTITRGDVLIEGGQTSVPFFVVKSGEIEVIRPSALGDVLIATVHAEQFTGDISMILGRPALMRLRVSDSGEAIELTRDQMHALIQADAEMSEVLMKALIYRRIELVAQGSATRCSLDLHTPGQRCASRHSSRETATPSSTSTLTVMPTCVACSSAFTWTLLNYRS